jgi:outer membrane protein
MKSIYLCFKITFIVLVVQLLLQDDLRAQGNSFTVSQAIEYALKNQVNVRNAYIETEIAQARINELIGAGLPQVKGTADITKFIEIPTQFIPGEFFDGEPGTFFPVQFGQKYSSSAGVSASQLLFDGSYLVGLQASKTYADLSRKGLMQSKIETAVNVTKAYYFVLVSKERLEQLGRDIERLGRLKSDTRALFENGFVEKIDYDRVELSYNLLESSRTQAERIVGNSYNLLKFQMGIDINTPIELTEDISTLNIEELAIQADTVDYRSRVEYSILETQHRLTELDVKKNQFSRFPTLVLFGNLSANASRNEFNIFDTGRRWYPTAIVGASLTVPIFGGFQKMAQTRQAKLNQQKVENSFYSLQEGITLEYKNALTNLRNNVDRLETQKRNRELAREIARVSKIKYDQGVGSNLEVIEAETSLREAETNYFTAMLEAVISKVDLQKASGTIKY